MLKYIRNQVKLKILSLPFVWIYKVLIAADGLASIFDRMVLNVNMNFQVMSLSPAPLSLLIKAAPILTDDMYGDIQPAAWELLLSVDEHMAAAAGPRFPYIG